MHLHFLNNIHLDIEIYANKEEQQIEDSEDAWRSLLGMDDYSSTVPP